MKKYVLTIIILFFFIHISLEKQIKTDPLKHYKNFLKAYNHIRKWEGNYSNLPYDKGGETYAGITKNFNQNWEGWDELEKFKKDSVICWNQYITKMEPHVINYYFDKWMNEGYYLIKDPMVANYVFDYRNSGNVAIKHIQQVLIYHGQKIKVTKTMNKETINAINNVNPIIFVTHLQEVRKEFYNGVADRNPELERYLKGWLNRANYVSS